MRGDQPASYPIKYSVNQPVVNGRLASVTTNREERHDVEDRFSHGTVKITGTLKVDQLGKPYHGAPRIAIVTFLDCFRYRVYH